MRGRLALVALALCAAAAAPARAQPEADRLARAAHGVLVRHCAACHGPDVSRPKGRFGHVLDLARLARERRHVRPGDPDGSPLYLDVAQGKMPPPESGRPPVPPEQRDLLRAWIAAGAPAFTPETGPGPADGPEVPGAGAAPGTPPGPARILGQFHPVVVHFPVALLLAAVLAEALAVLRRRPAWSGTARYCLLLGSLGAVVASATGWAWAAAEDLEASTHRWLGVGTTAFALGTTLLAWRARRTSHAGARWAWRLALLATAALVALTGYQGGRLTYGPEHHTWPF